MKSGSSVLPVWPPFAVLVGALGYLMFQWRAHPVPGKEIIGPIILLMSGVLVCLLLEGISYLNNLQVKDETNKQLAPEANEELTRVTHDIVRIVELSLAIPFAASGVLGLGHKGGIWPLFPVICLASVGLAVVVACRRLTVCANSLRARGLDKGLEGWNGIIYSNKNDPRIWVPKIGSIGYTLNFAHPRSWVLLALLVSPAVFAIFIGVVVKQWR